MRIIRKPGDLPLCGDTDWARLEAMTNEEELAAALADPDAQPLSPEELARMRRVSPVKVLWWQLSMTQAEFGKVFGLAAGNLRDWEQHSSAPDASVRVLLRAIEREPETTSTYWVSTNLE